MFETGEAQTRLALGRYIRDKYLGKRRSYNDRRDTTEIREIRDTERRDRVLILFSLTEDDSEIREYMILLMGDQRKRDYLSVGGPRGCDRLSVLSVLVLCFHAEKNQRKNITLKKNLSG